MKKIIIALALFSIANVSFAVQANTDLILTKESQNWKNVVVSLDIDNPSNQNISSVQSWLEFDKDKLNCKSINTDKSAFDFVVPWESNISWNVIKIWRSSLSWDVADSKINVVKINCEILKDWWEIRFHDYQTDWWKVSVMVFENWFPVNTLKWEPKSLKFETPKVKKFQKIQTQNNVKLDIKSDYIERPSWLKLDTWIWYVTLAWNWVSWAQKYYVYYWKISWRYLQRRLVPNNEIYKLEWLETWAQYFFAITAVWNWDIESDYSDEQAVIVWKPQTATSTISKVSQPKEIVKSVQNKNNFKSSINQKIRNKDIKKNVQSWPWEIALIAWFLSLLMWWYFYRRKFL